MKNRALASIQEIIDIKPIENADKIELAFIQGWQVVVKRDEFKIGDLVCYIEIDSRVDKNNEYFSFLESRNYKVKSIKIRGCLSQGLIVPLSILPNGNYNIGDDVTDILKITKIEEDYKPPVQDNMAKLKSKKNKLLKNPIIKFMMKFEWFRKLMFKLFIVDGSKKRGFPSWVVKSDEIRCQNMPWILEHKIPFEVSEKLDGSSFTGTLKKINKNKFDFIVCSRNIVVGGSTLSKNKKPKLFYDTNIYMEMAEKYNIAKVLKSLIGDNDYITIQGEIIGETIQGNKYNLKGRDLYVFNLITEKEGKINSYEARDILNRYDVKFVPLICNDYVLPDTIDELMEFSTGESILHDTLREGYVFRTADNQYSFKCVSNEFLLKHNL